MSKPIRIMLTFLVGCFFFVLLPVAGWGSTDMRSFFDEPARAAFLALVCILNAFAAIRIPEIGKKVAEQKRTVERQHMAIGLFQTLSIALVLVGPFCDRREIATLGQDSTLRWIGVTFYAFGFLLMHLAEWYLGKHFSLEVGVQEGHTLVTNGPYRYLLHPRYLGILLFSLGIALVFRSWIGVCLAAVTLGVILWRIHDEEALMQDEFGDAWLAHAQRRWRLIPYLY